MTGVTARNGSEGEVVCEGTKLSRITAWQISESISETAWGDSSSGIYTNRKAGRKDAGITFEGKFDTSQKVYNIFRVGDIVELVLWESSTDGDYWVFPSALVQSFQLSINQDTKEVIGWNASGAPDGIFYAPGQAGAPSKTLPS